MGLLPGRVPRVAPRVPDRDRGRGEGLLDLRLPGRGDAHLDGPGEEDAPGRRVLPEGLRGLDDGGHQSGSHAPSQNCWTRPSNQSLAICRWTLGKKFIAWCTPLSTSGARFPSGGKGMLYAGSRYWASTDKVVGPVT